MATSTLPRAAGQAPLVGGAVLASAGVRFVASSRPDGPVRAALVLGSGGARGYAHIGVIQVLEEHEIEIVAVAGSSMGALIGAHRGSVLAPRHSAEASHSVRVVAPQVSCRS